MTTPGQKERQTQERVVQYFTEELGYRYLGNWEERDGNSNVKPELLKAWLKRQGHEAAIIEKALRKLDKAANDQSKSLYDRNKEVYGLLRYGVNVTPDIGEHPITVDLINWDKPQQNDFGIAEEVTVPARDARAHKKRPDVVLYVNGIALGVLELKRSTVDLTEGIRQNLDNQKKEFIQPFFSTVQLIMAGNDTKGLRFGVIETKEKYYLAWDNKRAEGNLLDWGLGELCNKERLLEIIHDFQVYDAGIKKICRHNQYYGVKAAQEAVRKREGGIIWHTQGSGKSLTMVWLTKWIREYNPDARVLIITDRDELDKQIEKVYKGVDEQIHRTTSGADLIGCLNDTTPWLLCSLVHKFGGKEEGDVDSYVAELKSALPKNFRAKGDIYVFVDECHRTQSGTLHDAMTELLPDAMFIGFTGTPLLKKDKRKSIEVFGPYIHTYKFDEAVKDGVIVDLRYEARDIDQRITSQIKIDQWFDAKTRGLTDLAKAQLKQRWGTLKKVFSSRSRLEQIVSDILMDMETRPRLMDGHGNALLVAGSIYSACQFYKLFQETNLKEHCAIVTSYRPYHGDIKGEESGEGETEKLEQYKIYQNMLAEWFDEPPEKAVNMAEKFEDEVKKKFVEEPGQMKLLIVVDMLLTGFDAPSATYLYIDKQMRDHGLFQAICRVNRLDGDNKDYGYVIDYKDLFKSLEGAVQDYTSGAFDEFEKSDVEGLLEDRLDKAKERLEETREAIKALCEPVEQPRETADYLRYFCSKESGNAEQLKENEQKRLALYKMTASLLRAFANAANELAEAGYTAEEIAEIKQEVEHFNSVRDEVKIASGDQIDLKLYEPAMRHLIDAYIRAEESQVVSQFDDLSLIDLIVARGPEAVESLPERIKKKEEAVAETIENNVRRLIIDESPVNPKYYDRMSELLDALIKERRSGAIKYREYLQKIAELSRQLKTPGGGAKYPAAVNTQARRAFYDNLDGNEDLAVAIDEAIQANRQDDWRGNPFKQRKVKFAIKAALGDHDDKLEEIFELAKNQHEY